MSTRPTLAAQPRTETGKGAGRRLRAAGQIPAVVYGKGKDPQAIIVDPKPVAALLQSDLGRNTVVDLSVEGEADPRLCIMREFQVHPWKRRLEHVDFWEITPETELILDVPLGRTGKSALEAAGGVFGFNRKSIKIRCRPEHVPAAIVVDVTPLSEDLIALLVSELDMPEGVEAVFKHDFNILRIKTAKMVAAALAAEEEEEEGEEEGEGEGAGEGEESAEADES